MDAKKLDKLIKLIKLANHNNAEGEANTAARAACRILGEDNYKWITNILNSSSKQTTSQGARTWNDVKREPEPQWKSTQQSAGDESSRRWNESYQKARNRSNPWGNPFSDDPGEDTGFDWEAYWEAYIRDIERRQQEQRRRYREEQERRQRESKEHARKQKEARAQNWSWTGSEKTNKGYKKVYTQKCRDCTVCNIIRLTTDEDTPYVCYECKRKQ